MKKDDILVSGYVKDIHTAFDNVFGRKPDATDSELLSTVLYTILDSYYFNNLYQYKKIGVNENNEYVLKVIPNKNIETLKIDVDGKEITLSDFTKVVLGEQRRRMPKNEELPIQYFPQTIDLGINAITTTNYDEVFLGEDASIEPLKKALIELNPIYSVIFEENSIKQDLIKKTKKDIEYKVMNEQDFKEYVMTNILIQPSLTVDEAVQFLNSNYDLRYLVPLTEKRNNSFYVVAQSGHEIAGVAVVNENNNIKQSFVNHKNKDYANNFLRITSIMVASNYRGQGLGTSLFDELLSECAKQEKVLIVSNFTDLGKMHLKRHIAETANFSRSPVIDDAWLDVMSKNMPNLFNNSWGEGFDKLKSITDDTRKFYKEMDMKKMEARSADDIYDIEDAERLYLTNIDDKFKNSKPFKKMKM
jgi:ribosomal protein S18 acetylase RimI-like enzyme